MCVCCTHQQVYPEHKYLIVEALRQEGFAVGMTGDGVNDAPALKRADVGIAVEGATDAARAAADMVLTQPGLSVIVEAIEIARCIFVRMKNFINYRYVLACAFCCCDLAAFKTALTAVSACGSSERTAMVAHRRPAQQSCCSDSMCVRASVLTSLLCVVNCCVCVLQYRLHPAAGHLLLYRHLCPATPPLP